MAAKRDLCIIGGGPAGIMAVVALKDHCNVSCFERANAIGGQWAIGTDEFTAQHFGTRQSSLYKGLYCNAAKEAGVEVADFHWPSARPSFVPGEEISEYIIAYAEQFGAREHIQTHTSVEKVEWNEETSKFSVTFTHVVTKEVNVKQFDYVCVATGHFHYPNNPIWEGQETFPGVLIHSHDFTGQHFVDQRVLCIGGSYSAEDICLLTKRNGTKFSHVSSRNPFPYTDWPEGVCAKPILTCIAGSTVTFSDGSTEDYDVIINCTGFVHKFPFLSDDLQPGIVGNTFAPNGLYKQCMSVQNPQLFFLGMQNLAYTNPLFQLQSYLMRDVIVGKFPVPDKAGRQAGLEEDLAGQAAFTSVFDAIKFQSDYLNHLADLTGGARAGDAEHIWVSWVHEKVKSIVNFRQANYASIYSGVKSD